MCSLHSPANSFPIFPKAVHYLHRGVVTDYRVDLPTPSRAGPKCISFMTVPCLCYSTGEVSGIYWIRADSCQYNHQIEISFDILQTHCSILRGNQRLQKDSESSHQTQDTQSHTQTFFKQILRNVPTI